MPSRPSQRRPPSPPPRRRDPEYVAVVLAATQGRRLFPLTSEYPGGVPKHLLPVSPLNASSPSDGAGGGGGAPLLQRLLVHIRESGFEMAVVAIHGEDCMTVPFLLGKNAEGDSASTTTGLCRTLSKENESLVATTAGGDAVTDLEFHGVDEVPTTSSPKKGGGKLAAPPQPSPADKPRRWTHVRVVRLPEDCNGSADALRFLSQGDSNPPESQNSRSLSSSPPSSPVKRESEERKYGYIPRTSHAVVMPGDLILEAGLLSPTPAPDSPRHDGADVLSLLVQAHRRWNTGPPGSPGAACTMLLADVGAEDKEGVPLKESSKAKTGLLSREEEDMEYLGLSSEVPPPLSASLASLSHSAHGGGGIPPSRRVVLKRSKLEVEEDEGTGATPKLVVPKRRLHAAGGGRRRGKGGKGLAGGLLAASSTVAVDRSPTISLRTDLHDVHLYAISNWIFDLIHARPGMQSFQGEVLPLLISRQYRGVEAAFGPTAWKEERNREILRRVLKELDGVREEGLVTCDKVSALLGMYAAGRMGGLGGFVPVDDDDAPNPAEELDGAAPKADDTERSSLLCPPFPASRHPFAVSAQVLSREASSLTLRACTLPSLLYGCGAVTSQTLKLDPALSSSLVAKGATLSTKFNSVLMPSCTVGEKVQTKGCTIVGRNVRIGDRSRLNNVVVMDEVRVGNNTVLQNSLVGAGAKIGDNCNLRDCQVGPGAEVPSGTKTVEKGEAFHV